MQADERRPEATGLPRVAATLLGRLLPAAEREEVLSELAAEHRARAESSGRWSARRWLWGQVLASAPSLVLQGWRRGWGGFEPEANRYRPGGSMFESVAKDLRFSLRRLGRRPTYTVLAVLTLALGVSGTAAVYSIAKPLLLDPLPYHGEDEVVVFWNRGDWNQAEFVYLRPQLEGFQSVAAYRSADAPLQRGDAPATLVPGVGASAELFQVLGASPAIGRGFQPGDDAVGAERVVVLSHSLWRQLGGDPRILGDQIELGGVQRTVVGVMPPGFWFPDPSAQAWFTDVMDPENYVGTYVLIGRMAQGLGLEGMTAPLERITTLLGERFTYPEQWDKTRNAELLPLREYLVGSVRPALLAMLAAMAMILLIACVNVAALMLGQVDSRGTELAVRSALGAGRRRLLQQVVGESLVIGALAGVVGAALSLIGFRFLSTALPLGALAEAATVDWTLFGAAILIALLAATAVTLVPGASIARSDLQRQLTRSRTGGIGGRGGRLEGALVVAQVALVLLMASGAALLIRSVANLRGIDPGLEPQGVAVVDVVVPRTVTDEQRPQLVRELVQALEALPGVASAGAVHPLPLRGGGNNWGIAVEGRPDLEESTTFFRVVTPDYFETVGIQVLSGRGLLETDGFATEEGVVVINRALAELYFPGIDPIGQRIAFMPQRWDRIVGVIENVAEGQLTDEPAPARYMLYEHVPWYQQSDAIVLRAEGGRDAATLLDAARRTIQAAHPTVAVSELTTMENVFNRAIGPARQVMALLTVLSSLALALGVVGVYGVVSHFVTRRKRDWGIRIALGMRPALVVRKIVAQGGALVGIGIVLGMAAFFVLARLLASFLYGIGTADPVALLSATAILLLAGLLAAFVPARRASRIDPALVLREQ